MRNSLVFIISTYNRPALLKKLLQSISEQSMLPDAVVIVDAGSQPQHFDAYHNLYINHIRSPYPSLTMQRNIGLRNTDSSCTLVGFLDDDVILLEKSVEKMLHFWDNAGEDSGGCGFNIVNAQAPQAMKLKEFFGIDASCRGVVLPSGFNSAIYPVDSTIKTEWLCGGATVWRKEVFDEFLFDEAYAGYGACEDLDFSYRVGKKYSLWVCHEAQVTHLHEQHKFSVLRSLKNGRDEVLNRGYFLGKHPELDNTRYYWAIFGRSLTNAVKGITGFRAEDCLRALGNILGIGQQILRRVFKKL